MNRALYQQRKEIAAENRRFPACLVRLDEVEWRQKMAARVAEGFTAPLEVWRSRRFLLQVFAADLPAIERLTVCSTQPRSDGMRDGISWDELQRLKAECGRGDRFAVEVFPADVDLVNVANMRHLWILAEAPAFAWRSGR